MGHRAPNLTESQRPPEARPATAGFLLALRAAGRSEKTATGYGESLDALQRFSAETGMPRPEHMTAEHIREFLLHLYKKGNRPGTVATRYRALSSFYRWLVTEGERPDNPMDRIPPPKVEDRVMPHYTTEDVAKLLVGCRGRDLLSLRDTAIIFLLFDTGLRASELCGLTTDSVDLRRLAIHVRRGKGQKERIVGIGYKTAKAIERYQRRRDDGHDWLFIGRSRQELSFNSVRLMLQRRFRRAGLPFHGVHAFRRGFAIAYLESGGSPEDLRVLAGWDSPAMLRRYTRATERERALRGHRAHSPADSL